MCQALGVMPDLKYQRDGGPGPADIITTIRSVFAGEADVDRFVQALVFNWLIAGTDVHAENYGLVLSGTNARLAPLYDVALALVMPEWNWHKWESARRINKKGKFKYLSIEDWKKFATSAYIDFSVIETAIARYSPALCSTQSPTRLARWTSTPTSERSRLASPMCSPSTSHGSSAAERARCRSSTCVVHRPRLDVHLHGGCSAGPEDPFEFVLEHDDVWPRSAEVVSPTRRSAHCSVSGPRSSKRPSPSSSAWCCSPSTTRPPDPR